MRDDGVDISLVIPIYNVAPYLPDLLRSLSTQRPAPVRVEVIFVDDGSNDGGHELIEEWLANRPDGRDRLIRQQNRGVSAARNTGINAARGRWISFPDGDDVLDEAYIAEAWRFLDSGRADRASMVASRVLRLDDATSRVVDDHPLKFRFENGARVIDMERHPDYFQLHAASTFFRLDSLLRSGVRFPEGVHASEDALFIARHLLALRDAVLGVNPRARYLYRRRSTGESATDGYVQNPESAYLIRFRDHYAEVLRDATAQGGVPRWLQSMLLYEFHWALGPWQRRGARRPACDAALGRRILAGFAECARHLTPERIMSYDATALSVEARIVLLALRDHDIPAWVPEHIDAVDTASNRTRWRRWTLDRAAASLAASPSGGENWARNIAYFGPTPLWEVYEWRDGIVDRPLTSRTAAADRARRAAYGQRVFALSSRLSDIRVRRVRWGGTGVPLLALAHWIREALRRTVLSQSMLMRTLSTFVARTGRTTVVISGGAHAERKGDVTSAVVRVGASKGLDNPRSPRSLAAAVAIRRSIAIFADDPAAAMELLGRVRPRASQWRLTLVSHAMRTYDDDLAVAEASVYWLVEE